MEARKAAGIFPFAPEIAFHPHELLRFALDSLARLGVVDEDTLKIEIFERASLDGIVLPIQWEGFKIPDDWLVARIEAYVIPHEEQAGE